MRTKTVNLLHFLLKWLYQVSRGADIYMDKDGKTLTLIYWSECTKLVEERTSIRTKTVKLLHILLKWLYQVSRGADSYTDKDGKTLSLIYWSDCAKLVEERTSIRTKTVKLLHLFIEVIVPS
jgi:hypothetical protein